MVAAGGVAEDEAGFETCACILLRGTAAAAAAIKFLRDSGFGINPPYVVSRSCE